MALNDLWVRWLNSTLGTSGSGSEDDGIPTETESNQSLSLNYGFNETTWDRLRSYGNDIDNIPNDTGNLGAVSFLYGFDGTDWDRIRAPRPVSDALGINSAALQTLDFNYLFNETGFDRARNNTEETVLTSAARTATTNSADFINHNAKGIKVVIDVSAIAATPSITVDIQGKDPISGNYYSLGLVSAAITTVSTNVIEVFPGISEVANQSLSRILPRTYRVVVTHADGDSITYSVSGALVI